GAWFGEGLRRLQEGDAVGCRARRCPLVNQVDSADAPDGMRLFGAARLLFVPQGWSRADAGSGARAQYARAPSGAGSEHSRSIARHAGIDLLGPGIDAAVDVVHVAEPLAQK